MHVVAMNISVNYVFEKKGQISSVGASCIVMTDVQRVVVS